MYHDTIKINFKNTYIQSKFDIEYNYNFLISKNPKDKFSPINYEELLNKFDQIGFDLKYIKFYDISEDDMVYCTYNYLPNFELFFTAYKKILHPKYFDVSFEYGVIIDGVFKANNMNYFAGIYFCSGLLPEFDYYETIIKGKYHQKIKVFYQIVDSKGKTIASEVTDISKDFEQHFFDMYEVKVALRKYKLSRLKNLD